MDNGDTAVIGKGEKLNLEPTRLEAHGTLTAYQYERDNLGNSCQ